MALLMTTLGIDIYSPDYSLLTMFTTLLITWFLLASLLLLHLYLMVRGTTTWDLIRQ